jgi:hypothetical protein
MILLAHIIEQCFSTWVPPILERFRDLKKVEKHCHREYIIKVERNFQLSVLEKLGVVLLVKYKLRAKIFGACKSCE